MHDSRSVVAVIEYTSTVSQIVTWFRDDSLLIYASQVQIMSATVVQR